MVEVPGHNDSNAEGPAAAAAVLQEFVVSRLAARGTLGRQLTLARSLSHRDVNGRSAGHESPPAVDLLDDAIENLERSFPPVAAAIHELGPQLGWTRTASYLARPPDDLFLAKHAHVTVLGPADGAGASDAPHQAAIGLVLLGPGAYYPPHQHPADEVYVPGSRIWWLDRSGSFTPREPGEIVHHEPWQPHAMRVPDNDPPALLIYLWTGDVLSPSRWCSPDA